MIFLDTNLLWWIVHPNGGPGGTALRAAVQRRLANGETFAVAEICDYEARRELLRKQAIGQLRRLDQFISTIIYVPLVTADVRQAATFWAALRNQGLATSPNNSLDGDVILAAQALRFQRSLVATKNVSHINRLCNVIDWRNL